MHYDGDDSLDRLLAAAGSAYDSAGVRDLIVGVLGAPEGRDLEAWMELVTEAPPGDLRDQLRALKAQLAAAGPLGDDGDRLARVRAALQTLGLDGFVVPHADEHQGEYRPARAERLAWLTGFTGSMGTAVVLRDKAAIFVDGRYTLQVADQVDAENFELCHLIDRPPSGWIADSLAAGGRLGYDPWLHTESQVKVLAAAAAKAGGELVACADNPLDRVWHDQPAPPLAPVVSHSREFSGRAPGEKRLEVAAALGAEGADAAMLTLPDSIMWLLDVRGADVSHTPLPCPLLC